MNLERIASHSACLCLLATAASGQSFNIDVGDTINVGVPTALYAAAAAQPGFWNPVDGGPPYNFTIADLSGVPTAATTSSVNVGTGSGDFFFNNTLTTGDDEKLMDDLEDVGGAGSVSTWTFSGLIDGNYDVYTYAWAPDSAGFISQVTPSGTTDTQTVGGAWPGGHALGTTYARHCITVSGGNPIVLEIATGTGFGSVNGFQFKMKASPCGPVPTGTPFCDCTATAPCGNTGAPGNGCRNGSNPNGANLTASGTPDTANDTVVLMGSGATPGQPGLYFQGDNAINGGNGILFGDGLRCAGANVQRLEIRSADASGNSSTTVVISIEGGVSAGQTKHYQLWYRDPQGSPCGSLFNLSNGYTIIWQ